MSVREKGRGGPVRGLRVPSHVPSLPQDAAKLRGFFRTASAFTAETDCLLEESGFELMVPPRTERKWEGAGTHQHYLARPFEKGWSAATRPNRMRKKSTSLARHWGKIRAA